VHGLHFELEEILSHARDLEYDGIELFPFHGSYPTTPSEQRALRDLYRQYGLATPALQSETRGHAASPESKQRDAYVESVQRMIDFAHVLEASEVGIWSGVPLEGVPHDQQMQGVLDTCQRCAALAEEAGITLALEPEPVQVVSSLEDILFLLDGVDSSVFTALYDLSHANVLSRGRPLDFLLALEGRVGHVHFTDSDAQQLLLDVEGASGTSKHLAVGDGNLDLAAILQALKDAGYAGWMQVDVWENPDPYRASKLGKQYLDDFMGK
jgi:protein FrlC